MKEVKTGEVTQQGEIDHPGDEEPVAPESVTTVGDNITIVSNTMTPPGDMAFKEFPSPNPWHFVDIETDPEAPPGSADTDTSTAIKVSVAEVPETAGAWPLKGEGNLQPTGPGGGGGTLPHWSAKMAKVEVKLKLNMRKDGEDNFIYPSFYDDEYCAEMIQYKAVEPSAGIIEDVMVEVLDPNGNVDWSSEDLGASADWKDSGFEGRTNYTRAADGSTDADNKPNEVQGLFKFVDPGSSGQVTFTARLTVTLTGGGKLVETSTFQARARIVAVVDASSKFGAGGKAWIWKEYGCQVGEAPVCVNPAQDDEELLLNYNTYNFSEAYECLTPCGTLYSVNHGLPSGYINLGKHIIEGFEVYYFSGFRWGAGEAELLDVSTFAHAHQTIIELLHCYSSVGGGGAAKSLADTLSTKVGQGGAVLGYPDDVVLSTSAGFSWTPGDFSPPEAQPTGTKWGDFVVCVEDAITAELQRNKPQRHEVFDDNGSLAWTWVRDHTVQNIVSAVSFDQGWIIAEALTAYRALYEDDPTFTFTLADLQFLYDVNNAYNHQLGERQSFPK